MNKLSINNLQKKFGSFEAVKKISFSIAENQTVALLGPNGCGKTTTIAMILGLITPTSGSISITEKETGSYNVAYASIKNKKKYTSLVSSGWSSNYSNTKTTSVAYTCASASASNKTKQTIYNYKPPNDGPGAGIIVDENGNMIKGGGSGTSGAHACGANCFQTNSPGMKNWWTKDAQGNRIYPNRAGSKYRFVMTEGPSKSGNIASSCAQGNCKYNFSNNTYTVLSSGITYKAGESIDTRKPINP